MTETEIFRAIKLAVDAAPRNQFTAELHIQMIKYADDLKHIPAKDFCDALGLKQSYGTEFSKMRNLVSRLKKAGLNTAML